MTSHSKLRSAILSQDVKAIERLLDEGAEVDDADHVGITSLHVASMNNSSNIVQILISHGASIDRRSRNASKHYTPLHYAVEKGHEAIVKILLSNNADVNLRTIAGMSPLDIAVQLTYVDIARDLLSYGASINSPSSPTYSSSNRVWRNCQPLHRAVENGHDELVKLLIDSGADVNADAVSIIEVDTGCRFAVDSEWTPLHIAVEKGYVSIIKMLLEHGANVNADKFGKRISPLCVALKEASSTDQLLAYLKDPENTTEPIRDTKYEIITDMLLEHGATFVPEREHFQAGLHGAVKMGNTKTVERILKSFPDAIDSFRNVGEANCTLLHTAASVWNVKSVEFLIHHGANVNAEDSYGHTPIFYAVMEKDEILMDVPKSRRDDQKTVELLLNHASNVDCIDKNMQTSLHHAVKHGNYEKVNFLLMHNACIESHVEGIISPLHVAVKYEYVDIAKVLLDNGARINSVSVQGCASSSSNLDKPGNTTGSQGNLNYHPSSSDIGSYTLDRVPLVFDSVPVGSWTPLHCAVKKGHEELVKLLLSKADANCTNHSTPLYSAISSGHHRIVKLLLDHGFHINIKDEEMKKALFKAVRYGYVKTIENVFKFNPDVKGIVNDKGRTLLHKAVVYEELCVTDGVKEEEVAKLLIKYGCDLNAVDEDGGTPLMLALESIEFYDGKPLDDMVKYLLDHGACVDPTDDNLQTTIRGLFEDKACPLLELLFQYCSDVKLLLNANGNPFLHSTIEERYPKVAKLLIKYGADVNAKNIFGQRALCLATYGAPETVEMLIENGADVDGRDEDGKTALHVVASSAGEESARVMTLLLKYGADVNIKSNENLTALDYSLKWLRTIHGTRIILSKHLIKMKAANLFVSQHDLQSIDLCGAYKDFYDTCKAECEKMRKAKVADTSLCYYDILTGINYGRNERVVKTLKSLDYETKFPLYSDLIKNSFERAQKRVNLLNRIQSVSKFVLGHKLSVHVILMKILGYLSNRDLQNFIEACMHETRIKGD